MAVNGRDGGVIGIAGRMALEREVGRREGGGVKPAAAGAVVATKATERATGAGEGSQTEKDGGSDSGSGELSGDLNLSGRPLREEVPRKGAGAGGGARAGRRPLTGRAAKRCVCRGLAIFVFAGGADLSQTSPKQTPPTEAPNEHKPQNLRVLAINDIVTGWRLFEK